MDRRLAALVLAALLSLSGCSFLGAAPLGPGKPTPDAAPGVTTTQTPTDGDTESATATPTAVPLPAGYGPSGAANLGVALDRHQTTLVDSGSFTVRYQATLLTDAGRSSLSAVRSTNVRRERGYEATNVSNGLVRERFVTNGTAYVRTGPVDGEASYDTAADAGYDPRAYTAADLVRPALENVTYKNAERIERGNRTFFRYRASEVRNLQSLLGSGVDPANVTAFDAGLVVAADGSVQRVAYQATMDRGAEQFTVQVRVDLVQQSGVVLDEPRWLDEAKRSA
jgi:hypothetical protein